MEKLPVCRICLVENVRMYEVVNRKLHELYEKLTNIPFVTEDSRPILACFFCCSKLKQCYRLLRQCLEAEELFALMMNEDDEPNILINHNHFELFSGFVKSPIVHISIADECQTESITIKEEPAVCEGLDDIIEPKQEHQSHELELENFDNSCLDVVDILPYHSELDLEDDVDLMEFKPDVEEEQEEVSMKIRRTSETKNAPAAEKPKLDTRRIKTEDAITAEQLKNELSDIEINQNTQHRTSKRVTKFIEPFTDTKPGLINSFSEKGTKTEHIRNHTVEKPYKCSLCQCCFSHKGHLTRHIRGHNGEKQNKCEVCQRSFSQLSNLKRHLRIHNGEQPFKCDLCQRRFNDKRDLLKHVRMHNSEKPFKCDLCKCCFSDKRDLSKHIRKHTGDKLLKCATCQRSFNYPCDLKKHIRTHTGEKPYKCEICQRSFNIVCNLKRHVALHTGEKPFKCATCQHSFSYLCDLKKHNRIHTGEKPYKCEICQRSFNHNCNLKRHLVIHNGVKPFK